MKRLKFTIVTISYNAEKEIVDTIESVINQDYRPLEYVFVDGGSTDKTNEIIKGYINIIKEKGIEVKYISEPDDGISDAFNKGIQLSSGDIIGLINAGDGLYKKPLEHLATVFSKSNSEIVYGKTVCVDKKNGLTYLREIPCGVDVSRIKYNGLIFTHQSAFVLRSVYERYGYYDTSFKIVMDTDLFAKFVECGVKFEYTDEILVSMLAGGLSSKPSLRLIKEEIRVAEKYGGYSSKRIYFNWIKGLPRHYLVRIIKKFPKLWYLLIGKERNINENK